MIILMNSSKTLDFQQKAGISKYTLPELQEEADHLVKKLRKLSTADFSKLLKTSEKLTQLNVERYGNWQTRANASNAKQALLAFKGDIYADMDIENYKTKDFEFAQKHLRILSGLYGVLRPLDLIQPYRLEMATKLATARGKDLYAFWGTKINELLKELLKQENAGTLVNLCSMEYFKAVKSNLLDVKVTTPVFKEFREGTCRVITLYAKKARGMMCNYIIQNHLTEVDAIKSFNVAGYQFNQGISSDTDWVFTR